MNSKNFGIKQLLNNDIEISLLDNNLDGNYGFEIYNIKIGDEDIPIEDMEIKGWQTSDTKRGYPIKIKNYEGENYIRIKPGLKTLFGDLSIERRIAPGLWFTNVKYDGDKVVKFSSSNVKRSIEYHEFKTQKFAQVLPQYILTIGAIIGGYIALKDLLTRIFSSKDINGHFIILLSLKLIGLIAGLLAIQIIKPYLTAGSKLTLFGKEMGRYEYFMFIIFGWLFAYGINLFMAKHKKLSNVYSWIIFALNPLVAFAICEWAYNISFSELTFNAYALNYLILLIVQWLFLFITRSRKYSVIIILWIALVFGVLNQVLIIIRKTPMIPEFLSMITVAFNVAGETDFDFANTSIESIGYAILWTSIICSVKRRSFKKFNPKRYFASLAGYAICLFIIVATSNKIYFNDLSKIGFNWWKPMDTYYKNGTAVSFYSLFANSKLKEPEGYDEKEVIKILDEYKNKDYGYDNNDKNGKKPNVVVVLSEALMDYQGLGDNLYFSRDPLEYTKSLKENTISGTINMSVLGAGTIKSEYEVLTGNTLAFFPPGSDPSQQFIKEGSNSIVKLLKNQGYYCYGTHPQPGTNYSRNVSWEKLGFDKMDFLDEYVNKDGKITNDMKIRNFISDHRVYEKALEEIKNEEKPVFEYLVTMQNHGGYFGTYKEGDIQVQNFRGAVIKQDEEQVMKEYANLVAQSDQAHKYFFENLEKSGEDTIVLIFGDHQPQKADIFLTHGYGEYDDVQSHWTPFRIWANYDIKEQEDIHISISYLSALLFDNIGEGIRPSAYQKYLLDFNKEYPSITALFALDKDGNQVQEDEKYQEKKKELDKIIYFGVTNPKKSEEYFSKPVN
ncbi:MAG: sulfatase-like hydrolase/transferase [Tissierellia bacterium]|nr:sulfatase-like hydrolase/transferase [Tissierellia bacterium]